MPPASEAASTPTARALAGKVNAPQPGYGIHGNLHPDHAGTLLTLRLNGEPVATTGAGRPGYWADRHVGSGFLFKVQALFDHLGDGDALTVTAGDTPLPWADGSLAHVVANGRASRAGELLARIAEGMAFQKNGQLGLRLDRNEAFFAQIDALFERIRRVVQGAIGTEVFVTYGALLGCIREGDFIASDDDIDLAYLSRQRTPEAVRAEFERVARALIDDGLHVKVGQYANLVKISADKGSLPIDLFYAWVDGEGRLDISYGYHGPAMAVGDDGLALVPGRIGRYTLPIPARHDEMLLQLYGPAWRVPDQGFSHFDKTRRVSTAHALDEAAVLRLYWENFYAHQGQMRPSTFAEFVLPRLQAPRPGLIGRLLGRQPAPVRVIEFGCGNGRDALHFARHGHPVLGVDAAHAAVDAAARHARAAGLEHAHFQVLDLRDAAALDALLAAEAQAAGDAELLVYCRFFLHAIPEGLQQRLLDALCRQLGRGFRFAAEFRTDRDQALKKSFGTTHYRRFIDADALVAALERGRGAQREHFETGFGLSVYAGEDPHLCRMLLRFPAQPTPSRG
jgi:SAM-dependent methyltransferase